MRAVDLIRKKRDGHPLDPAEIGWMVAGIASGEVADNACSAAFWRAMDLRWKGMPMSRA